MSATADCCMGSLCCTPSELPTVSKSSELAALADTLLSLSFSVGRTTLILGSIGLWLGKGELGFVPTVEVSSSSVSKNRSMLLFPAETAFFI